MAARWGDGIGRTSHTLDAPRGRRIYMYIYLKAAASATNRSGSLARIMRMAGTAIPNIMLKQDFDLCGPCMYPKDFHRVCVDLYGSAWFQLIHMDLNVPDKSKWI